MFDLGNFVEDCKTAVLTDPTHKSVHELLKAALSDPQAVLAEVGEPRKPGIFPIYQSDTLTVLNFVWRANMTLMPHDHKMWAVIGLYGGREDTIFWRRLKGDPQSRIEAAGAEALSTGDVAPLGKDVIHSVTNPIGRMTGALHIYGGDFFNADRKAWDPESLVEGPYDIVKVRALFEG